MKSYRKELWFEVPTRRGFVNITPQVRACLNESGIQEGLALCNAMHITASVFINDDERGLHQDFERWLEQLAPHEPLTTYQHNNTGEDNGDAHLKRQIMGREVVVAITLRDENDGNDDCRGDGRVRDDRMPFDGLDDLIFFSKNRQG